MYVGDDITDDEETLEVMELLSRRPSIIRERPNHFQIWTDDEFFDRFRLSKRTAWWVLEMMGEAINPPSARNSAVPEDVKFLLTLRYYATGSVIKAASDFCGVHTSTGSRIVRNVSHELAKLRPQFIKMQQNEQGAESAMAKFFAKAGLPRCVGAIDCTHIKIQSPGGSEAEMFRNRKGFFSINVQTICDADLLHTNIVARWPGSTHDATIFDQSKIRALFENGLIPGVLVGDSGYPSRPYLVKRLANPTTAAERLYNESVTRTRNVVERSYGVWKRRFPILAKGINLQLTSVEAVIVATAVLHNIATINKENPPETDPEVERLIYQSEFNQGAGVDHDGNNHTTDQFISYYENRLRQ